MDTETLYRRVRVLLALFVAGLVVSGVTAFPLTWEVALLRHWLGEGTHLGELWPAMAQWITTVDRALSETDARYPFLFYGTDWLAFAHLVIAIAFWGPLKDPVRNQWVIEFGMIACLLVIPTALVFGPLRGIPLFWRLIDCLFGVLGVVPLWLARRDVLQLSASAKRC